MSSLRSLRHATADDRIDDDQVYRAGYLTGGADAWLEDWGASFDDGDTMQRRKAWHDGYAAGWKEHNRGS